MTAIPELKPVVRSARIAARALLVAFALWSTSCTEVGELPPCEDAANCPDGELCLAGACVPDDPCGAGIYPVGEDVPRYLTPLERREEYVVRSRSPEPESFSQVITPVGDRQLRIEPAGRNRLFEVDFYVPDGTRQDSTNGVFVEARVRADGPGGECQAIIEMRVPTLNRDGDPFVQARFCIGGGVFGPESGPTEQVIEIADFSEFHTFRIHYTRPSADLDAGMGENDPIFEIYVDGVKQDVTYEAAAFSNVALDIDAVAARNTFVRFGGQDGNTVWDFVRWGCVAESGVCVPKMSEGDDRPGAVEDDPPAGQRVDTSVPGTCFESRLVRGPCDGEQTGRSPGPEVCDYFNNDCDENTDEDYRGQLPSGNIKLTFYAFPEVAANPDQFPDFEAGMEQAQLLDLGDPCAIGACQGAEVQCNLDYLDNPSPQTPQLFCDVEADVGFLPERCDATDNDCDGYIDENYRSFPGNVLPYPGGLSRAEDPTKRPLAGTSLYLGQACSTGQCENIVVTCDTVGNPPTYESICDTEAALSREICGNRVDDDCDGTVDEVVSGLGMTDLDLDGALECNHCLAFGQLRDEFPEIFARYPEENWDDFDENIEGAERAGDIIENIARAIPLDVSVLGFDVTDPAGAIDLRSCFADNQGATLDPLPVYDCDDEDEDVLYGAPELCDNLDNDCDDSTDETDGPNPEGLFVNDACVAAARANNTEAICAPNLAQCSDRCLAGFDDIEAAEPGCEAEVLVDNLLVCDDDQPNTAPDRDALTGRYARDVQDQLLDRRGDRLRCSERCNGLDDDGDGAADEAPGMVLQTCYSGDPADIDFAERDEALTLCRPGTLSCVRGAYEEDRCIGEVLPQPEICDQLDNDCDGRIDEIFLGPEDDIADGVPAGADCSDRNPIGGPCSTAYFRCLPGRTAENPGFLMPPGTALAAHPTNGTLCVPEVKPLTLNETCNGTDAQGNLLNPDQFPEIDEDCDGRVDEQVGAFTQDGNRVYLSAANCGFCGNNCSDFGAPRNYEQTCVQQGQNFFCSDTCIDGQVDANDDAADGCECALAAPGAPGSPIELCDDGEANVECDVPCDAQTALAGMCLCGELGQPADLIEPQPRCGESCNGQDDDCDGRTDERRSLLTPLCYSLGGNDQTIGVGLCQSGRRACVEGALPPISPGVEGVVDALDGRFNDEDQDGCIDEVTPIDEVCDGLDNDCDGFTDEDFLDSDGEPLGRIAEARPEDTYDCIVPGRRGDCSLGQLRCGVAFERPEDPPTLTCTFLHRAEQEICGAAPERRRATLDEDCDGAIDEENGSRREDGERDGDGADSFCSDKDNVVTAACIDGRCRIPDEGCDLDYYDVNGNGDDGCEVGCDALEDAERIGQNCNIPMYPDDPAAQCACAGIFGCRLLDDGRLNVECRTILPDPDVEPGPGQRNGDIVYSFDEAPSLDENNERNRCQRKVGTGAERCDALDNDCNGQIDEPFTNDFGDFDGQEQGAAVINCGTCGTTCNVANGVPICAAIGDGPSDFECRIDQCNDTFADCDGLLGTGCETDRATSFLHCGACDANCGQVRDENNNILNLERDRNGDGQQDGSDGPDEPEADRRFFRVATACSPDLQGQLGECRCGPEDACDPEGQRPYCVGEGNQAGCVECREVNNNQVNGTNPDCTESPFGQFCFEGRCNACNPDTNQGCSLDDSDGNNDPNAQVCRVDDASGRFRCQACETDTQCTTAYGDQQLKYCHKPDLEPEGYQSGEFRGCLSCVIGVNNRPISSPDPGCNGNNPFCYPTVIGDQRGTCGGCTDNSDCPSENDAAGTCTNGSCGTCVPAGDQGCGNPTPVCDSTNFACRPCRTNGNAQDECQDPSRRPADGIFKPLCVAEDEAGQLGTCQQCVVDADCRNAALQRTLDENGDLVATTFDNHICCNFRCIEVDLEDNCRGCGVGCDTDTANICDANTRSCLCGDNPACRGLRQFCDSGFGDGECVVCRDDVDCPESTVCVDLDIDNPAPQGRACRECDPRDNPNVAERDADRACPDARPYCDLDGFACRGCREDAECADGDQCLADGTCGRCESSADCVDHPAGNICVAGQCAPCADNSTCNDHPDTLQVGNRCVNEGGRDVCRPCATDQECDGHEQGNRCVDGRCTSCGGRDANCTGHFAGNVCEGNDCSPCDDGDGNTCDGNPAGEYCNVVVDPDRCAFCRDFNIADQTRVACDPASPAPVCDEGAGTCTQCQGDFECAALNVADREICDDGNCHRCDPDDNRGCVQNAGTGPICRPVPNDGDNTFCDDCASDDECVGHPAGNLCVEGRCTPCANDSECLRDPSHPIGNVCLDGRCGRCDDAGDCAAHPNGNVCSGQRQCISCAGVNCGGHPNGNRCVVRDDEDGRGTCEQCNPDLPDTGCTVAAAEAAPICDADVFRCRPCASDAECSNASGGSLGQCVEGTCQACSPAENQVDGNPACVGAAAGFTCQPSQADPNVFTCQACTEDGQCSDGRDTGTCVDRNGRDICVECDPGENTVAGNALCLGRQTCIDDVCLTCSPDDNGAGGANANCAGGTCTGGACFACDVALNAADGNPLCIGGPGEGRQYGLTCIAGDCAECRPGGNNQLSGLNGNCGGTSCISVDIDGDDVDNGVCGRCDFAGIDDDLCSDGVQCQSDGLCRQCRSDADCAGRGNGEICDGGTCVACNDDLDCANHPDGNVCDGGTCTSCAATGCVANEGQPNEAVHPAGRYCDAGDGYCTDCTGLPEACVVGGQTSVCDVQSGVCRSCRGDLECPDAQNPICISDPTQGDAEVRICRVCDPADNAGCDAESTTPRCRDEGDDTPVCAGCSNDADCVGNANGNLCNTGIGDPDRGACEACADDVDCQNSPAGNVCRAPFCSQCTRNTDCIGNPGGNVCNNGFCSPCADDAACADHPAGEQCADIDGDNQSECEVCDPDAAAGQSGCPNNLVCDLIENGPDAGTVQCVGCVDDNDCGAGRVCNNGGCFGDLDGDGVLDADDNCPADANADQTDTDGDEDGDACDDDDDDDTIPDATEVANGSDPLDADTDDDTVRDDADNCPTVANGPNDADNQGDLDSDGDGDACDDDDDNDGVLDVNDNCPRVINPDQTNTDGQADGGDACDDDDDDDGVPDDANDNGLRDPEDDNCRLVPNADQTDTDDDGDGDACDIDDDADGVLDGSDNCPIDANFDQTDTNVDSQGDACDDDDDGDGVLDADDNCPLIANNDQTNTDGLADGGDVCDDDDDEDGDPDLNDNCPVTPNADQLDTDVDGLGDACDPDDDDDGVADGADNCPLVANADQTNTDGEADGGDACDDDDDNDGVDDDLDNCPVDANADQTNTDGQADGGDACDPDDDDDGVLDDVDGDGVQDPEDDNCRTVPNADQANADGDDFGDACDADTDNDGVPDADDNCPLIANGDQANTDGLADGGDACDTDDDEDGVLDVADNCPVDVNPDQTNTDGQADGGDACDPDDDGDGVPDAGDNCPLFVNVDQANNDGDTLGDACDNCPSDDNEDQADQDADDIGDVCDPDKDGDGINNDVDNCVDTANADQADGDSDAVGDACEGACAGDGDCDSAHVCDPGNSVCVQCTANNECDPGSQCRDFVCNGDGGPCDVANGDLDCNNGEICEANTCVPEECDGDADCAGNPNGEQCVQNRCEPCDVANGDADCGGALPICDANACRACAGDGECVGNAGGERCDPGGACVACVLDAHCPGQICEANACVDPECAIDDECAGDPAGEQCVVQRCEECDPADDAGCGIGENCVAAACLPGCNDDGDCGADQICEAGGCVAEQCDVANGNADCAANAPADVCDTGRCVQCAGDGDCDPGEICEAGVCGAQECDVANGDGDCGANQDCVAGRCEQCDVADANAGCNAGAGEEAFCVDNACVECAVDGDCDPAIPNCVAGVCVDLVDFCVLQFPVNLPGDAPATAGTTVTVFSQYFENGLTNATNGPDALATLVVELGIGPDGSDPDGHPGWRWQAMAANAGFVDANNDEYQADLLIPLVDAEFDFAARYSLDSGATYVYCDSGDGSSNGYAAANAGQLNVDPTEVCDDGVDSDDDGDTDCFDPDCANDPACLRAPAAGELVITEFMADSNQATDSDGEWIEAYNDTDVILDLGGVELRDATNTHTFPNGVTVPPRSYAVFTFNGQPAGGIDYDSVSLNNGGDTITFAVPGPPEVIIDTITYDDGTDWPNTEGESAQLSSTADLANNDQSANWCLSTNDAGGFLGTPGAANRDCGP